MDDHGQIEVPAARRVRDALRDDPIFAVLGNALTKPVTLGLVVALLTVAMILLGPSSGSRFIYTDF